jgi:hypothetical protein
MACIPGLSPQVITATASLGFVLDPAAAFFTILT